MKTFFVFSLVLLVQSAQASNLKTCDLVLKSSSLPEKGIELLESSMVEKACEGFAHLHLRQNEEKYQEIQYRWGKKGEWKHLRLEDVVDEVAHP